MKKILTTCAIAFMGLAGCKFYGSALPPEFPISLEDSLAVANDIASGPGGTQRPIVRRTSRPRVDQPSYIPEKELALVTPPQTLLVWTYPHITGSNQRVFGSWSTIFLQDRYQWVPPSTALPADQLIQSSFTPSDGSFGAAVAAPQPFSPNFAPPTP